MQPAARLSAAIEVLDAYLRGQPVEKALTNWARRSRFAGSKDRAAIRDIAFDCVRRKMSFFARSGQETGRGLVLGYCLMTYGRDEIAHMFTGEQHAPMPLSDSEQAALDDPQKAVSWAAQHDMPDWLRPELERSLGAELAEICEQSKSRAPIFLRVNLRKASLASVQDELARDNIQCLTVDGRKTALQVIENPRRLANSQAYLEGRIELQDAHSQAICAALPAAGRVLDYCAGGGGKILAYAALNDGALFAHDANAGRLADLSHRAKRGGHKVKILSNSDCRVQAPFDLVVCDVPCSGSGSWRRAPSGKWSLTFDQLEGLRSTQREILQEAARLVRSGGELAYVTCSLLKSENTDQVEWFVEHSSSFELAQTTQYYPSESGDGFFFARLTRRNPAT